MAIKTEQNSSVKNHNTVKQDACLKELSKKHQVDGLQCVFTRSHRKMLQFKDLIFDLPAYCIHKSKILNSMKNMH